MHALYLVHFGYLLQLFALLARDVLWLRGILVAAQSVLATYAYLRGPEFLPYVFWNALFVAINLYWVVRLVRERAAVKLPAELKALHEKYFAAMSPPEFLRIWREGERVSGIDTRLVRERNPALWSRLQSVLGHDLVEKLKRTAALQGS